MRPASSGGRRLERETGIEPATNSLEGCDSTTELLPPSRLAVPLRRRFGEASPRRPSFHVNRPASLSGPPALAVRPANSGGRRLERETGIEPATNSLEGCDSTTELLPPSRSVCPSLRRARPPSRFPPSVVDARHVRPRANPRRLFYAVARSWRLACQPNPAADRFSSRSGGRRLVARGGFEPPKPLGRQIYSLLRLTAPQPRRCFDRHTTANSCQMLAETTPGGAHRRRTIVPPPRPACTLSRPVQCHAGDIINQ